MVSVRNVSFLVALLALATGLAAAPRPQTAMAARSDFFDVTIRHISYSLRSFRVSADATFDLSGCFTYTCDEVVNATFQLRRAGRLVSQKRTQTYPRSSSLRATLPTFARCKPPGPLTPTYRTVPHRYTIILRALAYTGQTVVKSKPWFIICRR